MANNEIGFAELKRLVRKDWKLIVGLGALFGIVVLAYVGFVVPPIYNATAELVVQPPAEGSSGGARSVDFYRSLLESDSILEQTRAQLVADGIVDKSFELVLGVQATSEMVSSGDRIADQPSSLLFGLTGRHANPQVAAAIANTWARVFIAQSRNMVRGTAEDSKALLDDQLTPTRDEIEKLSVQLDADLDELVEREESASAEWDRKIAAAKKRAEDRLAGYRAETRELMEQEIDRRLPGVSPAGAGSESQAEVRSVLQEIVSVRAQLAQTPRVLDLEKAASDETLSELLVEGRRAEFLDGTLVSQEINPLYDQLAVAALRLESDLKQLSEVPEATVSAALAALERIQLERAAGQAALNETNGLEMRLLRRGRARELDKIARDRESVLGTFKRREAQLADLESKLGERLNEAVISGLLEDVELVSQAARAVPPTSSESRDLALKLAVGAFLGAMLGLVIALFRSVPG